MNDASIVTNNSRNFRGKLNYKEPRHDFIPFHANVPSCLTFRNAD